jgi:hypothetical protein
MTQILVNHLTRMSHPYICVAGIDRVSNEHVRPCLTAGRLPATLSSTVGGPFGLGLVVDLGNVTPRPNAPEIEDVVFIPGSAHATQQARPGTFLGILQQVAKPDLASIFGAVIERHGSTYALPVGQGIGSLGCLEVHQCHLEVTEWNNKKRIKARIEMDGQLSHVAVTDLRLYDPANHAVDTAAVTTVNQILAGNTEIMLSLGVGRPFAKAYDVERHWLQVNGIFPRTDPFWGCSHLPGVLAGLPRF